MTQVWKLGEINEMKEYFRRNPWIPDELVPKNPFQIPSFPPVCPQPFFGDPPHTGPTCGAGVIGNTGKPI